ncbi:MAG: hypothetical protein A2314_07710 [Elusimicrobia bacterium RIFOXYB2_FULL_50_12]|nr:MAG: hypothetical protein A2314_07710 [Elusimicrobia bacterium RIFOXYB2_FULL_50_12]
MKNRPLFISFSIILLATAIAYLPVLSRGFINLDDDTMVTDNRLVKHPSTSSLIRVFTAPHAGLYHPFVTLSYMLEYRLFGLNPRAYHTTNYLLHLLNTTLVFLFIYLLSSSLPVTLLSTLLFGLHPVHVESVAWISERKDVLYAAFFLASLSAYTLYTVKASKKYYIAAFFLFLGSLMSKPMALTLPLLLLCIDFYRGRKRSWQIVIEKIPFFALSLLSAVTTVYWHYHEKPSKLLDYSSTIIDRLLFAVYGIVFYMAKLLFPVDLSIIYPVVAGSVPGGTLVISFIAFLLIVVLVLRYAKNRTLIFGTFFFLFSVSPVLQILPVGLGMHADRYMYIPSTGIFFLISAMIYHAAMKLRAPSRVALFAVAGIYIALLSTATWKRTAAWDSIALWNNGLKQYPRSELMYRLRADTCKRDGNYEQALKDYCLSLDSNPYFAESYNNRGNLYQLLDNTKKAIADYSMAIKCDPRFASAYYNRGLAFEKLGKNKEALSDYSQALSIAPLSAACLNNRGTIYAKTGDYAKALEDFSNAIMSEPQQAEAYRNRAYAYLFMGNHEGALKDARLAEQCGQTMPAAFYEQLVEKQKRPHKNVRPSR